LSYPANDRGVGIAHLANTEPSFDEKSSKINIQSRQTTTTRSKLNIEYRSGTTGTSTTTMMMSGRDCKQKAMAIAGKKKTGTRALHLIP
jgi:hypothetical protein